MGSPNRSSGGGYSGGGVPGSVSMGGPPPPAPRNAVGGIGLPSLVPFMGDSGFEAADSHGQSGQPVRNAVGGIGVPSLVPFMGDAGFGGYGGHVNYGTMRNQMANPWGSANGMGGGSGAW